MSSDPTSVVIACILIIALVMKDSCYGLNMKWIPKAYAFISSSAIFRAGTTEVSGLQGY